MHNTYSDDCLEIRNSVRKSVVTLLTKRVRGYVYITFDSEDNMIVKLLDSNNEILHSKTAEDIISQCMNGFDSNKFCNEFVSEFKKKINKKYFKNPLDKTR